MLVTGAVKTVVCYQRSRRLKQERLSKLQSADPRQLGSKHNSVAKAGQPFSQEANGTTGTQRKRITSC